MLLIQMILTRMRFVKLGKIIFCRVLEHHLKNIAYRKHPSGDHSENGVVFGETLIYLHF